MNTINKFPHVPDPDALARELLEVATNDPSVVSADMLLCSEPPFFCRVFAALGKPVMGYFANPFGAYLLPGAPQEQWYHDFFMELAANPRNSFACVTPYLSALIY